MKKIPTLFERIYDGKRKIGIIEKVTPGYEWVLEGKGQATLKYDGSCCAIINGKFYKRYDAKHGKTPPRFAIPCQPEPDPITNHWPHWVEIKFDEPFPADKWFIEAYNNTKSDYLLEGTFEAIGPHFRNNPYHLERDILIPHGIVKLNVDRTFEGIKQYLEENLIEGIVFWLDNEPKCKIKREDFGFEWNKAIPNKKKAKMSPEKLNPSQEYLNKLWEDNFSEL